MSPMKEPTPAPIAAGTGPETSAKNTGITMPGRNSPIPKGVLIKLVKPLAIAYKAAHIAAVATNFDRFVGAKKLVNLSPRTCAWYINRGSKISKEL